MFCKQCGYNNDNYASMCKRCGSSLREADNYDKDESQDITPPSGGLRFVKKRENPLESAKKRFKKLEYAEHDTRRRMILIIIGASILLGLMMYGMVSCTRACFAPEPEIVYGSSGGNIANFAIAAQDGEYVYYSLPFGANPGLYRAPLQGGDPVKLSYRKLSQMAVSGDWLYGVDADDGCFYRMNKNGTDAQNVLGDAQPLWVNIADNTVYYIDARDGLIYRASVGGLGSGKTARAELIYPHPAASLSVWEDCIYFVAVNEDYVWGGSPDDEDVSGSDVSGSDVSGSDAPQQDSFLPEEALYYEISGSDIRTLRRFGTLTRAELDGDNPEPLCDDIAADVSRYGEYLYYASPATAMVSTGDFSLVTGKSIDEEVDCLAYRRINLKTLRREPFLSANMSRSPLNVTATKVYFVGSEGTLERTGFSGSVHEVLPVPQRDVMLVCVAGDWVYYIADSGDTLGIIKSDGSSPRTLAQRIVIPEAVN